MPATRRDRVRLILALTPALAVVVLLFLGGWGLGLAQSLGWQPVLGQTQVSLAAYSNLLGRNDFLASLGLTLWIATASTVLSSILAVASALFLRRLTWGRRWATFAFQLNLPIPHSVGAIAMLLLLGQSGFLARLSHLAGIPGRRRPSLASPSWPACWLSARTTRPRRRPWARGRGSACAG